MNPRYEGTLPNMPEPTAALRSRFPAALRAEWDIRKGWTRPRPGELRGHVFDFQDGLRLIISKTRDHDGLYLHLSASFTINSPLAKKLIRTRDKRLFLDVAVEGYRKVSGDPEQLESIGLRAGKGVPHWRRKIEDKEA